MICGGNSFVIVPRVSLHILALRWGWYVTLSFHPASSLFIGHTKTTRLLPMEEKRDRPATCTRNGWKRYIKNLANRSKARSRVVSRAWPKGQPTSIHKFGC
jgi:hypothetical protein